jgi:hypothetical protein
MGSALDLTNEPLRRLIVNAVYDLLGMPVPQKANVEIVGEFKPSTFGFKAYKKDQSPEDYAK